MSKLFIVSARKVASEKHAQGIKREDQTIDVESYRKKLLAKEEELMAALQRSGNARNDDSDGAALDVIDESVLSLHKEIFFAQADRDTRLLNQVQAALARIDDGTYGKCLADEEGIAEARLNAVPWASYCVRHQEQLDAMTEGLPIAV